MDHTVIDLMKFGLFSICSFFLVQICSNMDVNFETKQHAFIAYKALAVDKEVWKFLLSSLTIFTHVIVSYVVTVNAVAAW